MDGKEEKEPKQVLNMPTTSAHHMKFSDIRAVYTIQFVLVGLVYACGPCIGFYLYFDSAINNMYIMVGGLCGAQLGHIFMRSLGLRYTVLSSNALLFTGWIITLCSMQYMLNFDHRIQVYCASFVNGVSIGMLYSSLLPHLHVNFSEPDQLAHEYYWPQLGITLGVGIMGLLSWFTEWQTTLACCMVFSLSSMLTTRTLPRYCSEVCLENPPNNKVNEIVVSPAPIQPSTVNDVPSERSSADGSYMEQDRKRKERDAMFHGCMQQLTGLGILSLPEVVSMNLARDPPRCFEIFALCSIASLMGIRILKGKNKPFKLLPAGLMVFVYVTLCYFSQLVRKTGSFISLIQMIPVLCSMGIATAAGMIYVPMTHLLHGLPSSSFYPTMRVVLSTWWCFGFLFSWFFTQLLLTYSTSTLFSVLTLCCLLIILLHKARMMKSRNVPDQPV